MRITLLMFLAACKAPTPTAEGVDADGDGFAEGEDCNDNDAAVFPGAPSASTTFRSSTTPPGR